MRIFLKENIYKTFLFLIITIFLSFFVLGCSNRDKEYDEEVEKVKRELDVSTLEAYKAVPLDAVAVLDFESLTDITPLIKDTSNFAYGLLDPSSPIVHLQSKILDNSLFKDAHSLFVLLYSSKNEVSLLQILDLSKDSLFAQSFINSLDSQPHTKRYYNGVEIKNFSNRLSIAKRDNLILASTSGISIENALRHLLSSTSLLSNNEFYTILRDCGGVGHIYLNHKQIGKLFSGMVTRGFLKYSDFVLRYATWSALEMNLKHKNLLLFEGESLNNSDASNFSTIFQQSSIEESFADQLLPASTIFAVSINTSNLKDYVKSYNLYLDANKKSSMFAPKKEYEWFVKEGYTEVVSALCIIGGKYEWITFTNKRSSNLLRFLIGVKNKIEKPIISNYENQGYMAAVLGDLFSYCSEESVCDWGEWQAIGSQRAIAELANGKLVKLSQYLSKTPVSSFFSEKYSARVIVNIKEGIDTIQNVLQKYYRDCILNSLKHKNFEYATIGVKRDKKRVITSVGYYAINLSEPPMIYQLGEEDNVIYIDSTIKKNFGPFTLTDPISSDTLYFEQSKKFLSVSLSNNKKKGLWGLPMKDTIKGVAEMVKLSDNKSYVAFILANKLYLINKKGAYANGYPKELDVKVALGPKIVREGNDDRILILDEDNVITKLDLQGNKISDWKDIHADEFTHNLPTKEIFYGKEYYVLRTVLRTRIYTLDGEEITAKNTKKPISKDSPLEVDKDDFIKVMGLDGKEFLFNLKSGKIKRL